MRVLVVLALPPTIDITDETGSSFYAALAPPFEYGSVTLRCRVMQVQYI